MYSTPVTTALDLAVITPAAVLAGALILRFVALGYLLAVSLLVLEVMLARCCAAQTVSQGGRVVSRRPDRRADSGFATVALIAIWVLVAILRNIAEPGPADTQRSRWSWSRHQIGGISGMKTLAAVGVGVLVAGTPGRGCGTGGNRAEIEAAHAGDDVVAGPVTTSTYAVTVEAPADIVWSWLVQIGQDRGGMYSYEWLENLFGLDIHNTNQIRQDWQHLAVGDQVRVVPRGKPNAGGYAFASRWSTSPSPGAAAATSEHPWDATWAFLIVPMSAERSRLLSRSRTAKTPGAAGVAARIGAELMGPIIPDDPQDAAGHQGARRTGRQGAG